MVQRQEKKILQCLKRVRGDEEKKKTRNRDLSESLRQIKKSWSTVEVLHADFSFFSFLSLSVSWGAWVSERWYFCHKLWEEVNVRPPPAQVLCPNHPVTGKLFGKTGLVRQRVVGEHGVVPWGAGAVGVLTGGRVLLEGHRQVQVLLSEERSEVRLWCHSQTFSLFGGQMIGKKFSVLFQVFRIWNTLEMLCCFTLFTRMQL